MGGAIGGGMTKSCSEVVYYLDESLPYYIAEWMQRVGMSFVAVEKSKPDQEIIRDIGAFRHRGVWVTRDLGSRLQYRGLIVNEGISVAWINCGNATKLTQAFLVVSSAYMSRQRLRDANGPVYFNVRESLRGELPGASVSVLAKI